MRRTCMQCLFAILALLFLPPRESAAQGNPTGTITLWAAITGAGQLKGTTDTDGTNEWARLAPSAGITRQMAVPFTLGLSLGYATERWTIDDPTVFAAGDPWRDLARTSVGAPMTLAFSRSLIVGITPSVEWAGEPGADLRDARTFGAVLGVTKVWNPRLTLGGGTSVSRQFYSTKVSPFLIINWQLAERLRIANAHGAGPLSGGGIEFRCTLDPQWELALGGVIRSDRFRLAESGPYPGAIGERGGMPFFARASRKLGAIVRADVYAGAMVDGRLRIKDGDGNELATTRYPAAPAFAATLSLRR